MSMYKCPFQHYSRVMARTDTVAKATDITCKLCEIDDNFDTRMKITDFLHKNSGDEFSLVSFSKDGTCIILCDKRHEMTILYKELISMSYIDIMFMCKTCNVIDKKLRVENRHDSYDSDSYNEFNDFNVDIVDSSLIELSDDFKKNLIHTFHRSLLNDNLIHTLANVTEA